MSIHAIARACMGLLVFGACGGDKPRPDANDIRVATINVLHGLFCPGTCRLPERLDLLFQTIEDGGCPDVIALQEVSGTVEDMIVARTTSACGGAYHVIYERTNSIDDELILSRWPALASGVEPLLGDFRNVLWSRLDHPRGPVDLFATHLASTSDNGNQLCDSACPPECQARTRVECQALQLATFVALQHAGTEPAFIVGDFNAPPGSFVHAQFVDRGWSDAHVAAGNPDCDAVTGANCTSGRNDTTLADLDAPALNLDSRVDFIFVVPAAESAACPGAIELIGDADGDGWSTGVFAGTPAAGCGPAPAPVCWVSDHSGVQVDVNCL